MIDGADPRSASRGAVTRQQRPAPDAAHCLVCGQALSTDTVWCMECDTPYHQECYVYNGRCGIYGCTGMHFRKTRQPGPGVQWLEVRDARGELVPKGFVVDFSSGRESFTLWTGVSSLGIAALAVPVSPPAALALFLLGAATLVIRAGLDDYRIVDAKTRTIWLHRKLFRFKQLVPELSFDRCKHIVVRGKRHQVEHWYDDRRNDWLAEQLGLPTSSHTFARSWSVVVVTIDRRLIPVTDERDVRDEDAVDHGPDKPPEELAGIARRLGRIMELEVRTQLE